MGTGVPPTEKLMQCLGVGWGARLPMGAIGWGFLRRGGREGTSGGSPTIAGRPIGALTQDKPLPGGYLGTSLTASLSPKAHLSWTKSQIGQIGRALGRTPLPLLHIKQRLLLYGANSKTSYTHCLMALSPQDIREVDSLLEGISKQI